MYKLFVGGISQETTETDLRSHFSKFGSISKASIIYDKRTSTLDSAGASKGFGFIESDNRKTIERIFEVKVHFIKGRYVDINRALDKHSEVPSDIVDRGFKKLFVGGLSSETTDEDLFEYFSTFAPVFKAYVIIDPNTRESKSSLDSPDFGYVEFESVEAAQGVLLYTRHNLHGRRLTVENQKNGLLNSLSIKQKQQQLEGLRGPDSRLGFSSEGDQYPPHQSLRDRQSLSKYAQAYSPRAQVCNKQAESSRSNHLPVESDRNKSSSFTSNSYQVGREAAGPSTQHYRRPKHRLTQCDMNIPSQHIGSHASNNPIFFNSTENRNSSSLLSSQLYVFRIETETSRSCRIRRIDQLLAGHARSHWPQFAASRREFNL